MNTSGELESLRGRIRELEAEIRVQKEEISRLKDENRRWARMVGTDALTGLPNKVSFLRAIVPQAIQQAARDQKAAGFMLISADDLGPVNESYGREAGDRVIRALAELLRSLLDPEDRIGHLDGTHFAVILYPGELDLVRGRANMIRARVRGHSFPYGEGTTQITVSIGIASVEPEAGTNHRQLGEDVVRRLNDAVYVAKKASGNRVEVARDDRTEGDR
jgi:diguanylate cyclase (GGDEF)-like protein